MTQASGGLKLVVVIVSDADADRLIDQLVDRGYPATKIASTGGFLRRGNATILSGVEEDEVEDVLAMVRRQCQARTEYLPRSAAALSGEGALTSESVAVRVGGAIAFVLPVDRFEKT